MKEILEQEEQRLNYFRISTFVCRILRSMDQLLMFLLAFITLQSITYRHYVSAYMNETTHQMNLRNARATCGRLAQHYRGMIITPESKLEYAEARESHWSVQYWPSMDKVSVRGLIQIQVANCLEESPLCIRSNNRSGA